MYHIVARVFCTARLARDGRSPVARSSLLRTNAHTRDGRSQPWSTHQFFRRVGRRNPANTLKLTADEVSIDLTFFCCYYYLFRCCRSRAPRGQAKKKKKRVNRTNAYETELGGTRRTLWTEPGRPKRKESRISPLLTGYNRCISLIISGIIRVQGPL